MRTLPCDDFRESRAHEEALVRAKENVTLLVERAERLQGEIRGLLGLGFKPNQFSLQSAQLQSALEQIPYAQLEVTRAHLPVRSPPHSSFAGARCHADRLRRAGPTAPRPASSKGGQGGRASPVRIGHH